MCATLCIQLKNKICEQYFIFVTNTMHKMPSLYELAKANQCMIDDQYMLNCYSNNNMINKIDIANQLDDTSSDATIILNYYEMKKKQNYNKTKICLLTPYHINCAKNDANSLEFDVSNPTSINDFLQKNAPDSTCLTMDHNNIHCFSKKIVNLTI